MKTIHKWIVYVILCVPIFYGFTWIHEGGHAITAILTGNKVIKIVVNVFTGCCDIAYYNYSTRWIACIMGSISTLIVAVPLYVYSIWKKNRWVFIIAFVQIAKELFHWSICILIGYGDPVNLIKWADYYGLEILITGIYVMGVVLTIILNVFNFYSIDLLWNLKRSD